MDLLMFSYLERLVSAGVLQLMFSLSVRLIFDLGTPFLKTLSMDSLLSCLLFLLFLFCPRA